MASLAANPAYDLMEVDEFLDLNLGDRKAELVDGVILMMAGGSPRHAEVGGNIYLALGTRLRGSGCKPFNSDMPLRTRERTIRFPDVTIYCGRAANDERLMQTARVIFEVLSPSTSANDQIAKLPEYLALPTVDAVVFVDPENERVRYVGRDGQGEWAPIGADLVLPTLDVTIPAAEIFADD